MVERIFSADSHVLEPIDLWSKRIDARYRDQAPSLIHEANGKPGDYIVCGPLKPMDVTELSGAGIPAAELESFSRGGYSVCRPGGWDPAERVKDMDLDGVSGEVFYCGYGLFLFGHPDDGFQRAAHQAYNGWVQEYASYAPERLLPIANISMTDPAVDVAELTRVRKAGFRGILISNDPRPGRRYHERMWDTFWSAVEEYGMVVNIHILTEQARPPSAIREKVTSKAWQFWSRKPRPWKERRQSPTKLDNSLPRAVLSHTKAFQTIAEMITTGVLERHPNLKLVSVENDIGWLPHHLKAMEWYSHRFASHYPQMKLTAAEYWRRQVYATFQDDEPGVRCRDLIAVDRLMWGSDYPHYDSTFPHSGEAIARNFAGVPEDEMQMILHDNVVQLYSLEGV